MSYSQDVIDAWSAGVFEDDTVQAFTPKIYDYDIVTVPENEFIIDLMTNESLIDFFQYLVVRDTTLLMSQQKRYDYQVVVSCFMQITDVENNPYNTVVNRLEVIDSLVLTNLGPKWSNTVSGYQGGIVTYPSVKRIGGKLAWQGSMTYKAFKNT